MKTTMEASPIMKFFTFEHLPVGKLQETSRLFAELAQTIESSLPENAEKSVALRKILEAKDAAVRACLMMPIE